MKNITLVTSILMLSVVIYICEARPTNPASLADSLFSEDDEYYFPTQFSSKEKQRIEREDVSIFKDDYNDNNKNQLPDIKFGGNGNAIKTKIRYRRDS